MGRKFSLVEAGCSPQDSDDWLFIIDRDPCRVRLVRDRGQWSMDIAGPGGALRRKFVVCGCVYWV